MIKSCANNGIYIFAIFLMYYSMLREGLTQDLVAGVSISDSQNKVNQQATYRFTLIPSELSFDSGTVIQTFIPSTVSLILGTQNTVSICRRYIKLTNTTQSLSNCAYDSTQKMVQFTIGSAITFDVAYEYEIGYILNPGRSSLVTNFHIIINDKNGNTLYDTTLSSTAVQIYPGDIFSQSLTDSSQKVSEVGTFTFKFQISNAIPGEGLFQVTFPAEISVSSGIQNSDTRIKIYDQNWQTGQILAQSNSIYFQGALQGVALNPIQGSYIQIEIQKITNPKSLKQTSSFSISTLDSQQFTIDQTSSLLTVQPTIPGDIVIFSLGPYSSQSVGASTDLNFNIQIPQTYDNGGYLLITFPPEVVLSSITCYPYIGFVTQTSNCAFTSSSSPQIVKISNYVSSNRLYFLISSATNPNSTKTTSTFSIQAFDASNYLMSQILTGVNYTAAPATLKTGKSTRSQTQVAVATNNILQLSLTLTNQLYSGDNIIIKIPYEQMLIASNSQTVTFSSTVASQSYSTNFTVDSLTNSSYIIINLVSPCISGCAGNSVIQFTIGGLQNPGYIQSSYSKSIEIYTLTSDKIYQRDRKVTGIFTTPSLTLGPISGISVNRTNFYVNSETELQIKFSITTSIPQGGLIRIYFPSSSFYLSTTGILACSDLTVSSPISCSSVLNSDQTQGVSYIQFSQRCSKTCTSADVFSFQISNLQNKQSTKPLLNEFSVGTFTQELYQIDFGNNSISTGLDLLPTTFNSLLILSPTSNKITGALTTLSLGITTNYGINQSIGKLLITLPKEVTIASATQICTAQVPSASATITCSVLYSSHQILITNPNSNNYSLKQIVVTIQNGIINPHTTKPTSSFTFETSLLDSSTSNYYRVEKDSTSLTYIADTPNQLQYMTITRSDLDLNEATDLVISFTSFNPIPAGSLIIIGVPSDQVVFNSGISPVILAQSSGVSTSIASFASSQSDFAYITLQENCTQNQLSCQAGTQIVIAISGGINPSSMKLPTNSFSIKIQQETQYYSDQIFSGAFISPYLTAGQFSSISLSQNSNVIGSLANLTLNIKLNNGISSGKEGYLQIVFPTSLYYLDIQQAIQCFSGSIQVSCNSTNSSSIFGKSLHTMMIIMDCLNEDCASNTSRSFQINNLRNRYQLDTFIGVFQLQSSDSDSLIYDSSTLQFSATQLPNTLAHSETLQIANLKKSGLIVSQAANVQIDIINAIPFQKAQIIQISLPSSYFLDDNNPSTQILCKSSGDSTQIPCTLALDSSQANFIVQLTEFCTKSADLVCAANTTQSVVISGLSNRYNTKNITLPIYATIYTQGLQLYESTSSASIYFFTQQLTAETTSVPSEILSSDQKVGELTDIQFNFNLNNKILTGDAISIQFQTGFVYKTAQTLCSCQGNNSNVALQCEVSADQDLLITSIQIKNQQDLQNGTLFTVKISQAQNLMYQVAWKTNIMISSKSQDGSDISNGKTLFQQWNLIPNKFISLAATRDNNELSSQATLTITYQTSISILQDSSIMISIPTSQFVNSSQQISATYQYGNISILPPLSVDSDYYNFTISKICSSADCLPFTDQVIKFKGFLNPTQVQVNQKPIKLQIVCSDLYPIIQENDVDLQAQPPLKMGEILSLQALQTQSLIVGESTSYYFTFKFPATLDKSDYIYIQMPTASAYNIQGSSIVCTDQNLNQNLTCKTTLDSANFITQIAFPDYCAKTNCSKDLAQQVRIQNLLNVYFVRKRSESAQLIQIMATSQIGYVLSSASIAEKTLGDFQMRQIEQFTAKRSSTKAGDQNVDITLSFATQMIIPEGSILIYSIPLEQQSLKDLLSIYCYSGSTTLRCTVTQSNDTYVRFQVTEWCSGACQAGTIISLVIQRTINPSILQTTFSSSYQLQIQTSSGDLSQQITSGVIIQPPLQSIAFNGIQILKDANYVGQQSFFKFQIPMQQYIPVDTDALINIPSGIAFYPESSQVCSVQISGWNDNFKCIYVKNASAQENGLYQVSSVKILKVCSSMYPCYIDQTLVIRFSATNSLSTYQPSQPFNISFFQGSIQIGFGATTNSLLSLMPNNITASILNNSTCNQAGQICNLSLQINTTNPLLQNQNSSSYMGIQVPSKILMFTNKSCQAQLLSTSVACKIVNSSFILVTHNFDTKNTLSFQYAIEIIGLRAPQSTEATDSFQISTWQKSNNSLYAVDSLKQLLLFQVVSPNNFTSIKVTRTTTSLGARVSLLFKLNLNNPLPINGFLQVSIPSSQLNVKEEITQCSTTYLGQSLSPPQCSFSKGIFTLLNLCNKTGGCVSNQQLVFTLESESFTNPTQIEDSLDSFSDSIQVTSYYNSSRDGNNYSVDQSSRSVFLTPSLTPQALNITSLAISSKLTSDYIKMEFIAFFSNQSFKFTQDFLKIQFNGLSFNKDDFRDVTIYVNQQEVSIKSMNVSKTNDSIKEIIIPCQNSICQGQTQINIRILNLKNPYYKLVPGSIPKGYYQFSIFEISALPNKFVSAGSYDLADFLSNLQIAPLQSAQILQSQYNISSQSNLTLKFLLFNRPVVSSDSQIIIILGKSFSIKNEKLACSDQTLDTVLSCSYFTANNSVIVNNYFSQSSSSLSYSSVKLRIQGLLIPSSEIEQNITTSILSTNKIYAFDSDTLKLRAIQTTTEGCSQDCQSCSTKDPSFCYACKVPSSSPLIQGTQCMSECAQGYFEKDLTCLKCEDSCKSCQVFGQCSSCNPTKTFMDGVCLDPNSTDNDNKNSSCPNDSLLNSQGFCVKKECSSIQLQNGTQLNQDCQICGVTEDFCYYCQNNEFSLNGICVAQCPPAYFANEYNQCDKCGSLCKECTGKADYCTSCRKDVYKDAKLDLATHKCVSQCSASSFQEETVPDVCQVCDSTCSGCQGSAKNCTSCYFDSKSLADLFYFKNSCLETCPVGYYANYDTHNCDEQSLEFLSFPPMYLTTSVALSGLTLLASKLLSGRADLTSEIGLSLLTQVEFLNRVFLFLNLWSSAKVFSFCVTCLSLVGNSFLALYFTTLVFDPILNQVPSSAQSSNSRVFKAVVIVAQVSGVNTLRILTSNFLGLSIFDCKLGEIVYYVKQMETISLMSSVLNLFQLCTGVSCIFDFGFSQDAMGLGVNSIVLNSLMIAIQVYKYLKVMKVLKHYQKLSQM